MREENVDVEGSALTRWLVKALRRAVGSRGWGGVVRRGFMLDDQCLDRRSKLGWGWRGCDCGKNNQIIESKWGGAANGKICSGELLEGLVNRTEVDQRKFEGEPLR